MRSIRLGAPLRNGITVRKHDDETKSAKRRFGREKPRRRRWFEEFWNVATYRLYCLDGLSKVDSAEWIEADDDLRAIEVAKERLDGAPCELWQGPRLVARLQRRRD